MWLVVSQQSGATREKVISTLRVDCLRNSFKPWWQDYGWQVGTRLENVLKSTLIKRKKTKQQTIDVQNVFLRFLFRARFFTFFNVFYIANVFLFKKRSLKIPSEITFETTETNWVCMIVFLCAHVRISISTYILTSIVTYLPYRLPVHLYF